MRGCDVQCAVIALSYIYIIYVPDIGINYSGAHGYGLRRCAALRHKVTHHTSNCDGLRPEALRCGTMVLMRGCDVQCTAIALSYIYIIYVPDIGMNYSGAHRCY
jgi:hypothetical protein